jgi:16S rRNA (cytosine967-C5)-methyltransferase
MDISAHRMSTVANTVKVQRLNRVSLMVADAASPLPFQPETFDRVLLDAPCSGTGTLRHNPEIRWRLTQNDVNRLAEQQYRLLLNAAWVVRQGGVVVYSTCSVEREENEDVVADFLLTNEQFRQIRVPVNESRRAEGGAARTWPQRDGTDGFYIAAFERKSDK